MSEVDRDSPHKDKRHRHSTQGQHRNEHHKNEKVSHDGDEVEEGKHYSLHEDGAAIEKHKQTHKHKHKRKQRGDESDQDAPSELPESGKLQDPGIPESDQAQAPETSDDGDRAPQPSESMAQQDEENPKDDMDPPLDPIKDPRLEGVHFEEHKGPQVDSTRAGILEAKRRAMIKKQQSSEKVARQLSKSEPKVAPGADGFEIPPEDPEKIEFRNDVPLLNSGAHRKKADDSDEGDEGMEAPQQGTAAIPFDHEAQYKDAAGDVIDLSSRHPGKRPAEDDSPVRSHSKHPKPPMPPGAILDSSIVAANLAGELDAEARSSRGVPEEPPEEPKDPGTDDFDAEAANTPPKEPGSEEQEGPDMGEGGALNAQALLSTGQSGHSKEEASDTNDDDAHSSEDAVPFERETQFSAGLSKPPASPHDPMIPENDDAPHLSTDETGGKLQNADTDSDPDLAANVTNLPGMGDASDHLVQLKQSGSDEDQDLVPKDPSRSKEDQSSSQASDGADVEPDSEDSTPNDFSVSKNDPSSPEDANAGPPSKESDDSNVSQDSDDSTAKHDTSDDIPKQESFSDKGHWAEPLPIADADSSQDSDKGHWAEPMSLADAHSLQDSDSDSLAATHTDGKTSHMQDRSEMSEDPAGTQNDMALKTSESELRSQMGSGDRPTAPSLLYKERAEEEASDASASRDAALESNDPLPKPMSSDDPLADSDLERVRPEDRPKLAAREHSDFPPSMLETSSDSLPMMAGVQQMGSYDQRHKSVAELNTHAEDTIIALTRSVVHNELVGVAGQVSSVAKLLGIDVAKTQLPTNPSKRVPAPSLASLGQGDREIASAVAAAIHDEFDGVARWLRQVSDRRSPHDMQAADLLRTRSANELAQTSNRMTHSSVLASSDNAKLAQKLQAEGMQRLAREQQSMNGFADLAQE